MRFLADLSEDDVKWLDARAADEGKSRAAVLREAVAAYRAEQSKQGIERYFGLWSRHGSRQDGLAYEKRIRGDRDGDGPRGSGRRGP